MDYFCYSCHCAPVSNSIWDLFIELCAISSKQCLLYVSFALLDLYMVVFLKLFLW